jgi:nanoRNase/pAp phosphatase (c-di-AMP/oligoRNAs hydrolase)
MRKKNRTAQRLARLADLLRGKASMLIVLQDNPDPDAIAAAVALRELANRLAGVACSIAHGGTIGRAENRELVQYLGLNLRRLPDLHPGDFDLVALVDTQPGTGNNSLPPGFAPHLVVDHHPCRRATRSVPVTDVRSKYGATSTILWEYLVEAGIMPDVPLATALLYGIRSDTQDLGREAAQADIRAYDALFPLANKRMLGQIQRGQVPDAYYQMLLRGLTSALLCASAVTSGLGDVDNPDMIGEVADLLLRHERAQWSLCYGFHEGKALVSVRTIDASRRADDVARRVASRIGTSGGHATMAGAQVPLRTDSPRRRARLERMIRDRFLAALGIAGLPATHLVKAAAG